MLLLKNNAWNLWSQKIYDNIGGGDVASVEEEEIRSSTDSVNDDDDLFSEFHVSTCSGENVYGIFENEDRIITEDSIVWVSTNKKIGI